ncbi:MAG: sugar epimerase, partial [Actinobacteria bacterium]|nr:sugar epimerase [Actinomycetota bacterium]
MTDDTKIYVANAPVSYGAFEVTVGKDPNIPDGVALLDAVASAGYAGIDLGPAGYLGTGAELARRLDERGLGLSGAYIEFSYHDPGSVDTTMAELDAMLDTFDAVSSTGSAP